jgi:hypothetical protein
MAQTKEIHLPVHCLKVVQSREKTRAFQPGMGLANQFELGDSATIFVDRTPLAEGIITSVMIMRVSQAIDMALKEKEYCEKTREVVLAELNEYYMSNGSKSESKRDEPKKIGPKDSFTIIEWRYTAQPKSSGA